MGPSGLRQVHPPQLRRRPRAAHHRPGPRRRPGRHRAGRGRRTRLRRERIGFVFQGFHLMPYLTAEQNVGLPLRLAGRRRGPDAGPRPARRGSASATAAGHLPAELSGGQQQRVAIARALVDRPGRRARRRADRRARLDAPRREVLALLRDSVDDLGQTVVMVTHDPVAAAYADRVVFLVDGRVAGRMDRPDRRRRRRPAGPPRRAGRAGWRHDRPGPARRCGIRATAFTATFLADPARHRADRRRSPPSSRPRPAPMSAADAETLIDHGRRRRRLGHADRAVLRRLDPRHHRAPARRGDRPAPHRRRHAPPGAAADPRRGARSSPSSPPRLRRRARLARRPGAARRCSANGGMVAATSSTAAARPRWALTALAVVLTSLVAAAHRRPPGHPRPGHRSRSPSRARRRRPDAAGGGSPSALLLVGYGVGDGASSRSPSPPTPTTRTPRCRPPGSSSILVGVGLADPRAGAAALVRGAWRRPLVGRIGAAGHLAAYNTSRRAHLLGGVLAPVIVLHRGERSAP